MSEMLLFRVLCFEEEDFTNEFGRFNKSETDLYFFVEATRRK